MKLKNSYILLIVMSIFLLVSVGSVCASDSASDVDVLADDTDSDILTSAPIKTSVESENVVVKEKDPQEIPVTVKDNESQPINIVKGDLNVTEKNKTVKFDYNNSKISISNKLSAGNHSLLISYLGNANYTKSSTKMILSVVGERILNVTTSVNVNSTEKVVIPITLTDSVHIFDMDKNNLTLVLSYKEGNNTINKTISAFELNNRKIIFPYDINATAFNIAIKYIDGNKTLTSNVSLTRKDCAKIIPINLKAEYGSDTFTFKLVDVDNNQTLGNKKLSYTIITGSINTGGSATTDANGIATIDNSNLNVYKFENGTISPGGHIDVGKQLFSIKGDDSSIIASEIKDNFTITKAKINIVIKPYKEYYGSSKKVVINVTNAKSGNPMKNIVLHLYMANTTAKDYYFQTGSNGTAEINVSGLISGKYPLTVSNNDTKNIKEKKVSGTITILGKPTKMTVTVPKTYYYNSGTIAKIKVTDKSTGKRVANAIVLVQVYTGKSSQAYLYQANSKGMIYVNYAPAAVGAHKIVVTMADSRYSASTVKKTVTVKKATAKITAKKVTGYYKSGSTFIVKLTNTKNKKAIYAGHINVKIYPNSRSYYNYNGQTGLDGKLRISLDSFKPGTYKVVVSPNDGKNFTAKGKTSQFVIKKAPAKLTPKQLTAKKGENKKFRVVVKNTANKKPVVGVKVKIKVYTGKTVKTYTAKTNANGTAKLNVKTLSVGTHKVVVKSANKYVVASAAKSSIKITKT
ncbi:hypothetical protein [Methanobrevibacter sp.]|uniref:hypothetical protein n=1 Tax=Methanobrevibacter sp. TaxID=66852 RepID=UPI0038637AC7